MAFNARHLDLRRRLGGAALVLALAACAGGGSAARSGGTPSAAQKPAAAAAAGDAQAAAAPRGDFAPSRPQAPAYGADVGRCPSGGVFRAVMDELEAAAKRSKRPPPVVDGRVCAVAETLLRWDPAAGNPRPQVLMFISRWFGLPAAVQPPSIAVIDTEDVRVLTERIVQASGSSVLNAIYPRFAVASQRVRRDATKVAVVLLDAPVEIDPPFPRRLELGQKATLSGRLAGGLTSPRVQVSDARGQLFTPEQAPGSAFKAEVACGDRPGRILVEIRGELEGSSGVVASLPVGCGTDLPASIAIAPEAWPTDAAEAERRIFELVNEERKAAALAPLKWDPGVAGVARSISEDLAARGGSGGGDVGERMKREGIAAPLILQSAASERTFERVHDRLVSSPSNRANIMSPQATSVGIGAVSRTDAEGHPIVYVTEVFIKELPPVDVAKARQELKSAVAQKRKDARTTALGEDPSLDEAAQRYADALAAAGGNLPKEKHGELTAPLNKGFKAVTMVSGAKPEPLDFAEEPQVTAPGKTLGVGVAQGKHPALGRNAVYVVVMVGTPKAEPEPKREVTRSRTGQPPPKAPRGPRPSR